jgi:hypothetical protein
MGTNTPRSVLITQSNYIPWKGYFDAIELADVFVLYDDAQYTRRDWRNRNVIKTHQGPIWLTIPIQVKGRFHQPVKEALVADHDWAEKHWETIRREYARAAHFDRYGPLLEVLYKQAGTETRLSDINRLFLGGICDMLGIETPMRWSSEFDLRGDRNGKLINMCRDLSATHYLTGPKARAYLAEDRFRQAGIEVVWLDYSRYPEYEQLHGAFRHNVSAVDLLLNLGSRSRDYMKALRP